MKAWMLQEIGKISYEEVAKPKPAKNEVVVKVKAAGVCGSDIPRIFRDGAHSMPLIPGHEFSGEVVELGSECDKNMLHKCVGVYPLIPCRKCLPCIYGKYEMCRHYDYIGSRRNGGFAEYVCIPCSNIIELPDNVTYEQAAMLEPASVAVHAMRRISIAPKDIVMISGMGTIGMLLLMFLLAAGFENIFVIGNKECIREKISEIGLQEDHFINVCKQDVKQYIQEYTNSIGANVYFECVGNNKSISQAFELAAPGGYVCMVGNPHADIMLSKNTYWKLLREQLHIVGTWNSSFFAKKDIAGEERTDWQYALDCISCGCVEPQKIITHRFLPKNLLNGFYMMKEKTDNYIKVMAVFDK